MNRVLVAGVGNVFLGDDAFGVEVARRVAAGPLPPGVEVGDFGIAGVHLAYQMVDGYRAVVLVDAAPRGGRPGDLYVIEPDPASDGGGAPGEPAGGARMVMDAHGMQPEAVLRLVQVLGGGPARVVVVGCEPGRVEEGMGLSGPVSECLEPAVAVVRELVEELSGRQDREEGR